MYAFCTLHVHEEGQNCRCAFGKPAKAISTSETEFVRCSTWVADIENAAELPDYPLCTPLRSRIAWPPVRVILLTARLPHWRSALKDLCYSRTLPSLMRWHTLIERGSRRELCTPREQVGLSGVEWWFEQLYEIRYYEISRFRNHHDDMLSDYVAIGSG